MKTKSFKIIPKIGGIVKVYHDNFHSSYGKITHVFKRTTLIKNVLCFKETPLLEPLDYVPEMSDVLLNLELINVEYESAPIIIQEGEAPVKAPKPQTGKRCTYYKPAERIGNICTRRKKRIICEGKCENFEKIKVEY